jgi:predicted N-formylglutamate amidohydrolase
MARHVEAAVEIVDAGPGPVVLTCEHASLDLPDGWAWPDADRWLVGTHWSYDLGAAAFTTELAETLRCPAVLARFSRLLCDANREEGDPSLFRDVAEGQAVRLNADLSEAEKERRLTLYHRPYHAAVARTVGANPGRLVFSIHSFTPVYEGQTREVELGILFDTEDAHAHALADALRSRGFRVWMNEPYSGKEGLIYSATRHAGEHRRVALELEVRQDLATDPAWRARAVPAMAAALAEIGFC